MKNSKEAALSRLREVLPILKALAEERGKMGCARGVVDLRLVEQDVRTVLDTVTPVEGLGMSVQVAIGQLERWEHDDVTWLPQYWIYRCEADAPDKGTYRLQRGRGNSAPESLEQDPRFKLKAYVVAGDMVEVGPVAGDMVEVGLASSHVLTVVEGEDRFADVADSQWQSDGSGGWDLCVGSVEMRVTFESQTERFSWWFATMTVDVSSRGTYKTAESAQAACERVVRRVL